MYDVSDKCLENYCVKGYATVMRIPENALIVDFFKATPPHAL